MNIKKPISLLAAASLSFAANAQVVLINHLQFLKVMWKKLWCLGNGT